MTRIAVIGPGALGCLFAVRMLQSGMDVWLIDYDAERAACLQKQGIIVEYGQGQYTACPHVATTLPSGLDLALVLTKAYATRDAAIPRDTPVLTLQNGLGNAEMLAERCGKDNVLAGATSEAVTWLAPGHVRHVARGQTTFGAWGVCDTQAAFSILQHSGFNVILTNNPGQALWEKAVVSAVINPLTAVLNVKNGVLLRQECLQNLVADLTAEAVAVAVAEGCHFSGNIMEKTARICESTGENISSMLQDIRNRKRTEIEAISGEIMRRGASHDVPAPRTQLMYHLVSALELI